MFLMKGITDIRSSTSYDLFRNALLKVIRAAQRKTPILKTRLEKKYQQPECFNVYHKIRLKFSKGLVSNCYDS